MRALFAACGDRDPMSSKTEKSAVKRKETQAAAKGPPPTSRRVSRRFADPDYDSPDYTKGNSSKDLDSIAQIDQAARLILAGEVGKVLSVKLQFSKGTINDACREVGLDVRHNGSVHKKAEDLAQKGLSTIARAGTESDLEKRAESAESKCAALEKQLKGAHQ